MVFTELTVVEGHKRSENQIHRTRVREVRIQFPPAQSQVRTRFFTNLWRGSHATAVGRAYRQPERSGGADHREPVRPGTLGIRHRLVYRDADPA